MGSGDICFEPGFAWGTATSAFQSEGGLEDSAWSFHERTGAVPVCDRGNDKLARYEEDFFRLSELGLLHHRTSLAWSRIEPEKGVYNREAIDDYRLMMEAARRRGITLWITLHHLSIPAWFAGLGGFMDEAAFIYWHRFVELVAKELGSHAEYWIPVHEPITYSSGSYLLGKFPPFKKRLDKFNDILARTHRAHGDAYRILKSYLPASAKVGMAANIIPVHPLDPQLDADRMAAQFVDSYINRIPLDALKQGTATIPGKGVVDLSSCKGAADFFGIDYFTRLVVSRDPRQDGDDCFAGLCSMEGMPGIRTFREGETITEAGFGAYPSGIYEAVKRVHDSGLDLPIYITASGVATGDEEFRVQYISRCLKEVHRALAQGLDVRGYFHWSDVDTFEWTHGYDARYGLFAFDPVSMERIQRPAASFLSGVAKEGIIPQDETEENFFPATDRSPASRG